MGFLIGLFLAYALVIFLCILFAGILEAIEEFINRLSR